MLSTHHPECGVPIIIGRFADNLPACLSEGKQEARSVIFVRLFSGRHPIAGVRNRATIPLSSSPGTVFA